jgi:hypothetical protein
VKKVLRLEEVKRQRRRKKKKRGTRVIGEAGRGATPEMGGR